MNNSKVIKENFWENGWCKIDKFFNGDEIEDIKLHLDIFIKDELKNIDKKDFHLSGNKVNTIHVLSQTSNYFKNLLHNKKVLELMKNILDDEIEPQWSQLFAKPALVGLPSPMHQDNYYWNILGNKTVTMWIAIDEVSNENGGVIYYDKSHKLGKLEHRASYAKGTSQKVSDTEMIKIPLETKVQPIMNPGDILLHHGLMVHGSEANKTNRDRRGMSMWYKAKSAKVDESGLKSYNNSLEKQRKTLNII
jgi:ectoine hydroxylase-related dioxygenase (phytanoyl-CoA dioxygenase family)